MTSDTDDTSLDDRARALIRIGDIGIATEDQAATEAFFAPDFRFHGPDGGTLGREELWAYFAACRRAFDEFNEIEVADFEARRYVATRSSAFITPVNRVP